MMKVGIAGVGFMGWIHYLAYRKVPGVAVAAICDKVPKRLAGDWTDIKGNFGPPGEQIDVAAMQTYTELEQLVADPDLDLVDICLPPFLHADAAILALRAGKHVFCEKPMSLTTGECQRMVEAAQASGKQIFIGHVLPFFPEYAHARADRQRSVRQAAGRQFQARHFGSTLAEGLLRSATGRGTDD